MDDLSDLIGSVLDGQEGEDASTPDQDTPDHDDTTPADEQPEGADGDADDAPEPDADDDGDGDDEDGDPEEESDAEVLDLSPDITVRLPDGTEVSGEELAKGYLRQSDYTRKTQELAEQRKQLEAHQRVAEALVEDPVGLVVQLAAELGPEAFLTELLAELSASGALDRRVAEAVGLDDGRAENVRLRREAERAKREADRLRQEREQEAEQARAERERQERLAELQAQWDRIVRSEGLAPDQARRELRELVAFAQERGITDLEVAWDALQRRRERERARREAEERAERTKRAAAKHARQADTSSDIGPDLSGSLADAVARTMRLVTQELET